MHSEIQPAFSSPPEVRCPCSGTACDNLETVIWCWLKIYPINYLKVPVSLNSLNYYHPNVQNAETKEHDLTKSQETSVQFTRQQRLFISFFCTMTNNFNFNVLKILYYWDFSDYNKRTCIKAMWNILMVNCITNSCIWNTCVAWQGIDYKLPEDDTIVSKHLGVWYIMY